MAFTAPQKTLTYELLGMFEGNTYDWFWYRDREDTSIASSAPVGNQVSFTVATDRLEAIFTAIENASDNREARIGEILVEYDDISLQKISVRTGGTNTAPGARFSTGGQMAHLKLLIETHLGFHIEASSGSTRGTANSRNIGVTR